jgi:mannose-6-phosphate isomerase-like protein (cupin superfamily)
MASFRRVVTGHDEKGKAIILQNAPPPRIVRIGAGMVFYEIWNTRETPARIDRASGEPPESTVTLTPPKAGTRIRVVDFPPDDQRLTGLTEQQARAHFEEMGAGSAHAGEVSRHPYMHRTETIDYGIILEGEITLLVDIGEVTVRAGDIVIQRGTNHAWANRSGRNCRVAFILIDGQFDPGLA